MNIIRVNYKLRAQLTELLMNSFQQSSKHQKSSEIASNNILFLVHIILMASKEEVTIVYNKFCPFAHRALLAALQKGISVNFRSVSLKQIEPFFKDTYAKAIGRNVDAEALVPILIDNETIVSESEIICWYLAQKFTSGESLIPRNLQDRAKMRAFIIHSVNPLVNLFTRGKLKKYQSIESYQEEARKLLSYIDKQIKGPYVLGEELSLADILIYPWFQRWVIMEKFYNIEIGEQNINLNQWIFSMQKRSSVKQIRKMTTDQYYLKRSAKAFTPRL